MKRIITEEKIKQFKKYLCESEKSAVTVDKYIRDACSFLKFTKSGLINKVTILSYKEMLGNKYSPTSANSMIAALNALLKFLGWQDFCIKQFKV